jgi:glycosyltransferase involved in cell wall biosynthesis
MKRFSLSRRVLVVSSWAPPMTGGPQNLYNLLSRLSADSYCILTSYEAIHRGKATGTWLEGEYFFYDYAHPTEKTRISTPLASRRSLLASVYQSVLRSIRNMPSPLARLVKTILYALYLFLNIFAILRTGVQIVRHREIRCIIGISDTGPALISAYLISRCTGVPYALYLFDIYLGNNLLFVNELLAKMFEPQMFRTASMVIVTNEGTERFYRKRYGDRFKCAVIPNSVFPESYESKRTPYLPTEPYTIVFTGNVYWAQQRSLMNLIRAMDGLHDLHARLHLYVPIGDETLVESVAGRTNVHLTSAPQSHMPDVQCNATILFMPLSWQTRSPEVIATATPGKLADYMASGRPILIHAPRYAYVNEYARQHVFALLVDEEDIEKLRQAVRKLVLDVQYSRRLIENALNILYKNHDARANAKELAKILELV